MVGSARRKHDWVQCRINSLSTMGKPQPPRNATPPLDRETLAPTTREPSLSSVTHRARGPALPTNTHRLLGHSARAAIGHPQRSRCFPGKTVSLPSPHVDPVLELAIILVLDDEVPDAVLPLHAQLLPLQREVPQVRRAQALDEVFLCERQASHHRRAPSSSLPGQPGDASVSPVAKPGVPQEDPPHHQPPQRPAKPPVPTGRSRGRASPTGCIHRVGDPPRGSAGTTRAEGRFPCATRCGRNAITSGAR